MQIKDAYEKIGQCKSEVNAAKCIRRNRQGKLNAASSAKLLYKMDCYWSNLKKLRLSNVCSVCTEASGYCWLKYFNAVASFVDAHFEFCFEKVCLLCDLLLRHSELTCTIEWIWLWAGHYCGLNVFLSEYDALAKVIQQHPDRQETLRLVFIYCHVSDAVVQNSYTQLYTTVHESKIIFKVQLKWDSQCTLVSLTKQTRLQRLSEMAVWQGRLSWGLSTDGSSTLRFSCCECCFHLSGSTSDFTWTQATSDWSLFPPPKWPILCRVGR